MLVPQTTPVPPNALYASQITLGSYISNGTLVGCLHGLALNGAVVDSNGVWSTADGVGSIGGLSFNISDTGVVTGLPDDLSHLGPQVLTLWSSLVSLIGDINAVRKLI